LRFNINYKERFWKQATDNFSPLDIWYITSNQEKKDSNISFESNSEKIEKLSQQLDKL
jgi:hypothetical protein